MPATPLTTFEEIAERVSRSRFSFAITFLTAKVFTHWKALFILTHIDGRPWNAQSALAEAITMIEGRCAWEAWGVPFLWALGVSAGYPFLAAALRTCAVYANAAFKTRSDKIQGRDWEARHNRVSAEVNDAQQHLNAYHAALISAYATLLDDNSVEIFLGFAAIGRFFVKAPDGRLVEPDATNIVDKQNVFVTFLNIPAAGVTLASRRRVWLQSNPFAFFLLTPGNQTMDEPDGVPTAFELRAANERRGTGKIWDIVPGDSSAAPTQS